MRSRESSPDTSREIDRKLKDQFVTIAGCTPPGPRRHLNVSMTHRFL